MPRMGISSGVSLSGVLTTEFKAAGFRFKLTRGDGAAIGLGYTLTFSVKNSLGVLIGISYSYDAGSGYWTIVFDDPADVDPLGHWVEYNCAYGLSTQYPYRYKTADKGDVTDLIDPGTYEDTIPYWIETVIDLPPINSYDTGEWSCRSGPMGHGPSVYPVWIDDVARMKAYGSWRIGFNLNGSNYREKELQVKSSVPYKVYYRVGGAGAGCIRLMEPPAAWVAEAIRCGYAVSCVGTASSVRFTADDAWSVDKDSITIVASTLHSRECAANVPGVNFHLTTMDISADTFDRNHVALNAVCAITGVITYTYPKYANLVLSLAYMNAVWDY